MKVAVIFGGTGFIGLHFSRFLIEQASFEKVVLADIKPPQQHQACRFVEDLLLSGKISYVESDVRKPINLSVVPGMECEVACIANFAAVHREPGHLAHEYFETNILGARNVTAFAEAVCCEDMIFTSSISPYGPSESPKSEEAVPTPETPYGSSKLAAELIHEAWLRTGGSSRRLLTVRPGVVFGPGEGGNVSRLVNALTKGFFVYAGNRATRKAGIYVKELCRAMWWLHEHMALGNVSMVTANMSMNPGPSMEEYVETIQQVAGRKAIVPAIPVWSLMFAARLIQTFLAPLGVFKSVNVVRVRKIIRSNNIVPGVLVKLGYPYRYTLRSALEDWLKDMPAEWNHSK